MLSNWYMWFSYTVSASFLVYLVYQSILAQKRKPAIVKADIVYQEWFASGHSEASFLTRVGGARNCLRLIVTSKYLMVTSWFPFSLFSAFYDLEHVIPLKAITQVEQKRISGEDHFLLSCQEGQSRNRKISLTPRKRERFLAAIGQNASLTQHCTEVVPKRGINQHVPDHSA